MGTLDGQVAFVTGAGRRGSLGYGIAQACADAGAALAVTGRSERALKDAARGLQEQGADVLALRFDGLDAAVAPALVEQALERFGHIDVLVTCGGYAPAGVALAELAPEALECALASGISVPAAFMRACHAHMRERGGAIVNVVAQAAAQDGQPAGALAASVSGLLGLTRAAAAEWAGCGITVNAVCPLAHTAQLKHWAGEYPHAYDELLEQVPLGRLADACDDVGAACVFLAGPGARCITGQVLCVDGGFHLGA